MRIREVECLAQGHAALWAELGKTWAYCHSYQADSVLGQFARPIQSTNLV